MNPLTWAFGANSSCAQIFLKSFLFFPATASQDLSGPKLTFLRYRHLYVLITSKCSWLLGYFLVNVRTLFVKVTNPAASNPESFEAV